MSVLLHLPILNGGASSQCVCVRAASVRIRTSVIIFAFYFGRYCTHLRREKGTKEYKHMHRYTVKYTPRATVLVMVRNRAGAEARSFPDVPL